MTKGKVMLWGFLLSIAYFIAACILPTRLMTELLNGMFVGIMAAVGIVYLPLFWQSLKTTTFDRTAQLAVGIGCLWLSLGIARVFSVWIFASGRSGGFLTSPWAGYAIFLGIVGGALHITAPGYPAEQSPPLPVKFAGNNRIILLVSGTLGLIVAVALRFI